MASRRDWPSGVYSIVQVYAHVSYIICLCYCTCTDYAVILRRILRSVSPSGPTLVPLFFAQNGSHRVGYFDAAHAAKLSRRRCPRKALYVTPSL